MKKTAAANQPRASGRCPKEVYLGASLRFAPGRAFHSDSSPLRTSGPQRLRGLRFNPSRGKARYDIILHR